MASVYESLGSWILQRELEDKGLISTPQYDLYEDEMQNEQTFPQLAEELEPMPEVGNHYVGAELLLPRGDEIARGHVVTWSDNASGHVMGRAHANPMMDTIMYQIELAGNKVTELTPTSLLSQSMPNTMQMGMHIYS